MGRLSFFVAATLAFASPFLFAPARADHVTRWRPYIAEASMRYGVPEDWIARVMRAESSGRIRALSPKGAMGLMQLMPGTWAELRRQLRLGADPYDPRDNILAGTFYLKMMHNRFGYPGLFAAYNAGPTRYADHVAGRSRLPFETRAYLAGLTTSRPTKVSGPGAPDPARSSIFFALGRDGPGR